MRIEQAVAFVQQSLERMKGGEIFVPELRSFHVEQLASVMLTQAGRTEYEMTGLRPGEKLHERLIVSDEARRAYHVPGFGYVLTREPDKLTRDAAPDDEGRRLMRPGFGYDSETNELWLSDEDLIAELEVVS
jgi:UDP-N-acetylglucosamine 4,6-dehydratase